MASLVSQPPVSALPQPLQHIHNLTSQSEVILPEVSETLPTALVYMGKPPFAHV